ncbi:MAG: nitrilase-related carbon-nitrogen hydrolase, partial [Rhodanobacteraceae bacterium]
MIHAVSVRPANVRCIVSIIKAAVVQAAPVPFDREASLDKVASLAASAAERGAQLAVFPEAFVSAYPKG